MNSNHVIDAECIFEKKKWISITGLCNNNCMFCLDSDRSDKKHRQIDEIKEEIEKAKKYGAKKLILSGGDPTIHPEVIEFVKYAKKICFEKVQLITNGRMFASKKFTEDIIDTGLDEVTFSIHGPNPEMHDSLTMVPGSFKQIIKGIKNVRSKSKNIIINTDTCITKMNYKEIPNIIRFIFEKAGINEINLMSMVPQGNAWKNRDLIMCEYEDSAPYVKKAIEYCSKNKIVLWLSRFPAEYLEGYEEYIEDPYKMVDDVRGRSEMFGDGRKPICLGERCKFCGIKYICPDLRDKNNETPSKNSCQKVIEINKDLIEGKNKIAADNKEKISIKLVEPTTKLEEYRKVCPMLKEVNKFLKENIESLKNCELIGVPYCCAPYKEINVDNSKKRLIENIKFEEEPIIKKAEELSRLATVKRVSCKECIFDKKCSGAYIQYVRIYGFKELKPIK